MIDESTTGGHPVCVSEPLYQIAQRGIRTSDHSLREQVVSGKGIDPEHGERRELGRFCRLIVKTLCASAMSTASSASVTSDIVSAAASSRVTKRSFDPLNPSNALVSSGARSLRFLHTSVFRRSLADTSSSRCFLRLDSVRFFFVSDLGFSPSSPTIASSAVRFSTFSSPRRKTLQARILFVHLLDEVSVVDLHVEWRVILPVVLRASESGRLGQRPTDGGLPRAVWADRTRRWRPQRASSPAE